MPSGMPQPMPPWPAMPIDVTLTVPIIRFMKNGIALEAAPDEQVAGELRQHAEEANL